MDNSNKSVGEWESFPQETFSRNFESTIFGASVIPKPSLNATYPDI